MKLTSFIASIAIAASVSAAQADTANDFAECVVDAIVTEKGITREFAELYMPDMLQNAKDVLATTAEKFLALPEEHKPDAMIAMWVQIPQSRSCTSVLVLG